MLNQTICVIDIQIMQLLLLPRQFPSHKYWLAKLILFFILLCILSSKFIYVVGHTNDVNVCNNCYSSRASFCALFWCQIMLNEHYLIMAKSIDGGGQKSILLTLFPILQAHSVTVCVWRVHYKLQCTVDRVSSGEIYRVAFLVETKYQIYLHKYKIVLKKFLYCKSWKAHQVFSEKLKFFTNTTNETHLQVCTVSRKLRTEEKCPYGRMAAARTRHPSIH